MILAELNTGHFEFKSVGETHEQAKERVTNAFVRHLQECGSSMQQWREDVGGDYARSAMSFRECIEDWYGINTWDFGVDTSLDLRDGATI
jgi:hypothetical protein